MNNIRVEIRIKNNILYSQIYKDGETAVSFCRKHDFPLPVLRNFISMKKKPISKSGKFKDDAIRLSNILKMLPEDLFDIPFCEIEKNTISLEGNLTYIDSKLSFKPDINLAELKITLKNLLGKFKERDQDIISYYYGLDGKDTKSLAEIARIVNLSPTRVSDIHKNVLRKLRHPSRSVGLKYYREDII